MLFVFFSFFFRLFRLDQLLQAIALTSYSLYALAVHNLQGEKTQTCSFRLILGHFFSGFRHLYFPLFTDSHYENWRLEVRNLTNFDEVVLLSNAHTMNSDEIGFWIIDKFTMNLWGVSGVTCSAERQRERVGICSCSTDVYTMPQSRTVIMKSYIRNLTGLHFNGLFFFSIYIYIILHVFMNIV